MTTSDDCPDRYTDEQAAALNASVLVDDAQDYILIGVNDMVRKGATHFEAMLAFEAALGRLRA